MPQRIVNRFTIRTQVQKQFLSRPFHPAALDFGHLSLCPTGSFDMLVAEQLFCSGCRLLISVTSAGQISELGRTATFILIDRALRDEGTSHHYLPTADFAEITGPMRDLGERLREDGVNLIEGAVWTTDAPFRETREAIEHARSHHLLAVEMEAAALYALAQAKSLPILCFAKVTNQMATVPNDFEKGAINGNEDLMHLLHHDRSADYVMLFNILHAEQPEILLHEARRILAPGGLLAVMHWNYDETTPRGPAMAIRPRPEDCRQWVEECGFVDLSPTLSLPPWHYGFTAKTNHNQKEHSP